MKKGIKILIMGLPGSGKTTLASNLVPLLRAKWINADKIRKKNNDWDFSNKGRRRQAIRMANLSNKLVVKKFDVVNDFICPTKKLRELFKADYTVWVDTIKKGRYENTNKLFEPPKKFDFKVNSKNAKYWSAKIYEDINDKFKTKLLDCTLRDGGYYNNWDFSKPFIQKYLNGISSTGVKYIEIGFRFFESKKIKGLTAYTNKKLLSDLIISKKLKIGVMINASDLIVNNKLNLNILKNLINKDNSKKLNFVRFACHFNEVFHLTGCFNYLRSLKLKIFINIMQISEIQSSELNNVLRFLTLNNIDTLYLADSLGSLTPIKLNKIINIIRSNKWKGDLGIHAHNNLKLALKNSIFAISKNFKWVDCTITGMGRGPGNLRTEDILKFIENYRVTNNFVKIKNNFNALKNKYGWGPNRYYRFAAEKKIHPTYVQKILANKRYSKNEYKKILICLSKSNAKKFNLYKLSNSVNFIADKIKVKGLWTPEKKLKGKNVLILGSGKNLKENLKKIESHIKEKNFFVIALNTFSSVNEKLIGLRAMCHPFRITSDITKLHKYKSKLVIPLSSYSKSFKNSTGIQRSNFYDYGMLIGKTNFVSVKKNSCVLPNPLAVGYALSLCIAGKAKSTYLAGFDGYEKSDPDYDNTEELLKIFEKKYFKKKFVSLTKSKFKSLTLI